MNYESINSFCVLVHSLCALLADRLAGVDFITDSLAHFATPPIDRDWDWGGLRARSSGAFPSRQIAWMAAAGVADGVKRSKGGGIIKPVEISQMPRFYPALPPKGGTPYPDAHPQPLKWQLLVVGGKCLHV